MDALSRAFLIYSSQILLVVSTAAIAEVVVRMVTPAARLAYWRAIGVLCLALPLFAAGRPHAPAASVTLDVLPAQTAAVAAVSKSLPEVGPFILWIWVAGVIAGVLWLLTGAYRVRQMRQRSVAASVRAELDDLRLAVAPRAEFRWSVDVQQPVTLGIRRPIVLLPRRFEELTFDAQRAVACHELLHIRRGDWMWTVLEAHVRVLFWFHPAVWLLLDRLQLLREQLIDRLVVERTSMRRDYMLALIAFADGERPIALSSAFLRRRHLRSRLSLLMKENHMSVRRLLCTMAALTLIVGSVTIATVRALPLEVASLAQIGSAIRLEIRLAEAAFTPGTREAVVSGSDQRVYLHPTTLATWSDVTVARIVNQRNAGVGVAVTFSDAAAARLATATAGHLDRPVAIMLDGRVVSAPIVRSPISDSAMITGITAARAQELIDACQSSAAQCAAAVLPIPIHQERPQYTPAALQAQIQGSVLLETTVLADGSASNVKVIRSLDTELGLDQEAVKALQRWTWKPGTRSGKPADVAVQIEMTFTLK